MRTLRIEDKRAVDRGNHVGRILSFDLIDILAECRGYSDRFWVAWEVECTGSVWCSTLAMAPNKQTPLSFDQLLDYAQSVTQTSDGYFLALRSNLAALPELDRPQQLVQIADVIINAFDANFWEVTTNDEDLISRLMSKFEEVSLYDEMLHDSV